MTDWISKHIVIDNKRQCSENVKGIESEAYKLRLRFDELFDTLPACSSVTAQGLSTSMRSEACYVRFSAINSFALEFEEELKAYGEIFYACDIDSHVLTYYWSALDKNEPRTSSRRSCQSKTAEGSAAVHGGSC